jgi:hypothetical protein
VSVVLQMAEVEDADPQDRTQVGRAGGRKRKWTEELDVLLLREAKLQKPHEKRFGDRGTTYALIAENLNAGGRIPWQTDQKHVQGRLSHLLETRRSHQRVSARSTGVEEEYGEAEVLVDELIEETDRYRASEIERRDLSRDRDAALADSGRQAREIAMRRQAPIDIEAGAELAAGNENDDEEINLQNECSDGEFSFPASSRSPTVVTGDIEAEVLKILRETSAAVSKQISHGAEMEERRLKSEEERDASRKELDEKNLEMNRRRIKVEKDREARLERQESRQSQMEELRIAGQKAQTELMTKMLEMFQQRKT